MQRRAVHRDARRDEREVLRALAAEAATEPRHREAVARLARGIAAEARERMRRAGGLTALLHRYDLTTGEGVLLLCLAESLLRIPDAATAHRLIEDVLARGEWAAELAGERTHWLAHAAVWGLWLGGRLARAERALLERPESGWKRLAARVGEETARLLLREAMRHLAGQFVFGETLAEALRRAAGTPGIRYSFDCLGEAAVAPAQAERYHAAYAEAIRVLGEQPHPDDWRAAHGVSVKLSALHPRYEYRQQARIQEELLPRLRALCVMAKEAGIGLTIDAEEADRLELQLALFEAVRRDPALSGWDGLGLAVQAYQKRAPAVIDWLRSLAEATGCCIPVRLVKGAYWDTEIKRAQERGLDGFPVFTRKAATDTCYQACVRRLFAAGERLYPRFATHNAWTLAWILHAAPDGARFEFQRLQGMGEEVYAALAELWPGPAPVRIYAPVGTHEALLPYLVRRMLENGANTSFVNQLAHDRPLEDLVRDPLERLASEGFRPHPAIRLPRDLYGEERRNSLGDDLSDPLQRAALLDAVAAADTGEAVAWAPLSPVAVTDGTTRRVTSPADRGRLLGTVHEAGPETARAALARAAAAQPEWDALPVSERAACLRRTADLLESRRAEFIRWIVREGGRCLFDAQGEVREAVDFLRYYAARAERDLTEQALPGPVGEENRLTLHGRGVFLCLSPWNFPLSIFLGQVAAALVAGNAVLAKPARQTPLVALAACRLLLEAGVPPEVLHCLPGSGAAIGEAVIPDPRLAGIAVTGSTETAWTLHRRLAAREAPIARLVAETGGMNAMIVDSSALPEQVVTDVVVSAFDSAGQRCSALRVLFLQEETADALLELLAGAIDTLRIGDPMDLATDLGPLIDAAARAPLERHIERMRTEARLVHAGTLPGDLPEGAWLAPHVFELDRLDRLTCEVFGPILHVVRWQAGHLDAVIDAINATGYGLTLGVHSRLFSTWERVRARARVGNLYVNRNLIGAVVGTQPFGGEGLSGTGPKAGGTNYLPAFATERTYTVNTAAIGGTAGLLALED
ncbi:MAG: bifunctional proline dehydrogenase/L-glutamate gamma-semialdehyde dehydrogenase PutA [Gammaproteobacteria bacterium]|nr:MAG: bifunctional proline dehydrogenase/L-glutamate gamma-semialdehyde dehydrogenase PutA [Gammaproteobacteria bacterium]